MVNKTISLSYEMFEKLQLEPNASGLIQDLLRNHYNSIEPVAAQEILEEKAKQLEEEKRVIEKVVTEKKQKEEEMKEANPNSREIEFFKMHRNTANPKYLIDDFKRTFGACDAATILRKQKKALEMLGVKQEESVTTREEPYKKVVKDELRT